MAHFVTALRRQKMVVATVLAGMAVLVVSVGILGLALPSLLGDVGAQQRSLSVKAFDVNSAIAKENQQRGTTDWEITPGADLTYLQGYAGDASVLPGQSLPLYISAITAIHYNLDVYRIGWYQGLGGRLMFSRHNLISPTQGYWTYHTGLKDCRACTVDPATHLTQANWQETLSVPVRDNWLSGAYLAKLTGEHDAESYIFFVVRSTTPTAALASFPVNTYQAYNMWGDWSLYNQFNEQTHKVISSARAFKVSFDRPYDRSAGAGDFLSWDIHIVRWLERSSMDVSYTTSVDVAAQPSVALRHRIYISLGHDEYWSTSERNGIESARDHGVSLAFLGANDSYWHVRFEPDDLGHANRTLVCYKVASAPSKDPTTKLSHDPIYQTDPSEVTTQFRDPALNRPESDLLGLQYISLIADSNRYHPDWIVRDGQLDSLEIGTGLKPNEHIKGGLLGYEFDGLGDPQYTPKNLVILAESPLISYLNHWEIAVSAYYRADSGALVFDAGSIWWGWGLDEFSPYGAYQANVLKGNNAISNLMTNIFNAMFAASPQSGLAQAAPAASSFPSLALVPLPIGPSLPKPIVPQTPAHPNNKRHGK